MLEGPLCFYALDERFLWRLSVDGTIDAGTAKRAFLLEGEFLFIFTISPAMPRASWKCQNEVRKHLIKRHKRRYFIMTFGSILLQILFALFAEHTIAAFAT